MVPKKLTVEETQQHAQHYCVNPQRNNLQRLFTLTFLLATPEDPSRVKPLNSMLMQACPCEAVPHGNHHSGEAVGLLSGDTGHSFLEFLL